MTKDTDKLEVPAQLKADLMKAVDMFLEIAKDEESVERFLRALALKIDKGLGGK